MRAIGLWKFTLNFHPEPWYHCVARLFRIVFRIFDFKVAGYANAWLCFPVRINVADYANAIVRNPL